MVFFLNSKVKTHTEDALQYIFDENKEKIVILGYSIVSRRSPLQWNQCEKAFTQIGGGVSGGYLALFRFELLA